MILNTNLKCYCNLSFEETNSELKQTALKSGGPAHNGSPEMSLCVSGNCLGDLRWSKLSLREAERRTTVIQYQKVSFLLPQR